MPINTAFIILGRLSFCELHKLPYSIVPDQTGFRVPSLRTTGRRFWRNAPNEGRNVSKFIRQESELTAFCAAACWPVALVVYVAQVAALTSWGLSPAMKWSPLSRQKNGFFKQVHTLIETLKPLC
jgi:hypothetical protein